ncbi:thioredoxin reductase [Paenibacillus sp. V4I7]|nr:thioredoxin reductase [Paenibacillus sp. V4I7]MDQ0920544.1 thioredoxin reductase [Paenibacillus sp. V4I5]
MGIPGEKDNIRRGVSTCASCDGFFFRGKKIIVVGGGDSAMEEAHFLTKFASEVRVVNRREELRALIIMQDCARNNSKITWSLNKTPLEVVAGSNGVNGFKVSNTTTGEEEIIETDGIFVTIGHTPNTKILNGQLELDEVGYVVVKPSTSETNIPSVCLHVEISRITNIVSDYGGG